MITFTHNGRKTPADDHDLRLRAEYAEAIQFLLVSTDPIRGQISLEEMGAALAQARESLGGFIDRLAAIDDGGIGLRSRRMSPVPGAPRVILFGRDAVYLAGALDRLEALIEWAHERGASTVSWH